MHSRPDKLTVENAFFEPLRLALCEAAGTRNCPEFSDDNWLRLGVQRVLEASPSGRAFLQEHAGRFAPDLKHDTYFASLHSQRRLELAREVNASMLRQIAPTLPDRLADLGELDNYECFACDGHWHGAAAHDPRHEERKVAVGHFYGLDLRRHTLGHLATGRGLHEHDTSALKRVKPKGLRHGVPKGRRVLIVYDKGGIDLKYWDRCRRECAVYFLSRVKENMVLHWGEASPAWDPEDPRNRGVIDDRRATTAGECVVRVIDYRDPVTGRWFEFLTNETHLSPGVLAELYRRRWDIEKVFDEVKNKLGQQRAWGSGETAREIQAHMILITHNLLLAYERDLEERHEAINHAENRRRVERGDKIIKECERAGELLSPLAMAVRRAAQRGVKFIRWLRRALADGLAEAAAVPALMRLYARL